MFAVLRLGSACASRFAAYLPGLFLGWALAFLAGCASTDPIVPVFGTAPLVVFDSGEGAAGIEERVLVSSSSGLSAIRTSSSDSSQELRLFRPDRSGTRFLYRDGRLVAETEFDEKGEPLKERRYAYRSGWTLETVSILDRAAATRILMFGHDGRSVVGERKGPSAELSCLRNSREECNPSQSDPSLAPAKGRMIAPMASEAGIRDSAAAGGVKAIGSGEHWRKLTVQGVEREYLLYIPGGYDGRKTMPLVLVLHGAFTDSRFAADLTRMSHLAEREGFVVVYPQATPWLGRHTRCWNVGTSPLYRVDDVEFIKSLMDLLQGELALDRSRTYVTGYSMGAAMTHQLAIAMPNRIAAVACVNGWLDGRQGAAPASSMPVLLMHGTGDFIVPFVGRSGWLTAILPVMKPFWYTRNWWVKHNACSLVFTSKISDRVLRDRFLNPETGAEVVQYLIINGEHAWPGSTIANLGGTPTQELDATTVIWSFLSRHSRKG